MFRIIYLNNYSAVNEYIQLYKKIDQKDPYFLFDYINIFNNERENLVCFVYESFNNVILLPGYLNPIKFIPDQNYFDFMTPYGYTGPYMSQNIPSDEIYNFWQMVDDWYHNNNVISEFIRFNLFNNNRNFSGQIVPTLLNIKGMIVDEELQWRNFDHKVRKNVKRAQKENLKCEITYKDEISQTEISDFFNVYIHTMQRTNANEEFFYSFEDFETFIKNCPGNAAICNVKYGKEIISSELVLLSEDVIYSFLGGTDERYFNKRPNDLLKYEIINWARKLGIKYYILGGGYGNEDGIFNYKKSFFPNDVVSYTTGRKIINYKIYREILDKKNKIRLKQGLEILDENDVSFFPLYNKND